MLMRRMRLIVPALAPVVAHADGLVTGVTGYKTALGFFFVSGLLFAALLFRSIAAQFSRMFSGRIGRARVRRILARRSSNVLSSLTLSGAYGGQVSIDYAALTSGGILCVDCVAMAGTLFADENAMQWTCVDGARRQLFLNPLVRNAGRVRALRDIVADVPIANLVVFTGRVQFTVPPPANVITIKELHSYIGKFVFGPSQVKDFDAVWLSVRAAALDRAPA